MLALARRSVLSLQQACAPRAIAFSSSSSVRALDELIPQKQKEGDQPPTIGRAWEAAELRQKSWDDLHKLWFVLLKERARLQSEKLMAKSTKVAMSNPQRLTKVRRSMNRIKQVLSERLREHDDPRVRAELKAVIDAM
eukprot:scaffold24.g2929.t1